MEDFLAMPQLRRHSIYSGPARRSRSGSAWPIPPPPLDALHSARVVAIDPGAVNCGMAYFHIDPKDGLWMCTAADKTDPVTCIKRLRSFLAETEARLAGGSGGVGEGPTLLPPVAYVPGVVVIEEYRLYPDKMAEQALTALGVVETIGGLRWVFKDEADLKVHGLVMQSASIKAAGQRQMAKARLHPIGRNQHARDAEFHGWYYILAKMP